MASPKSSIDALFPKPIDCGFGVSVYPLTLAHYALLEKINSYLVNGNHQPDSIEVIKTLYICTRQASEVAPVVSASPEELERRAFEWAETLPPMINQKIVDAIAIQIDVMMKVIPITGDDDKKKVVETDS